MAVAGRQSGSEQSTRATALRGGAWHLLPEHSRSLDLRSGGVGGVGVGRGALRRDSDSAFGTGTGLCSQTRRTGAAALACDRTAALGGGLLGAAAATAGAGIGVFPRSFSRTR